MNRITAAIQRVSDQIASASVPVDKLARLNRSMDATFTEWSAWQQRKSLAHASGALTFDEAQTVYAILGATPADFNARPVAEKVTVTKLMAELFGVAA